MLLRFFLEIRGTTIHLNATIMMTLRILALVFSICIFGSCTSHKESATDSQKLEPAESGVGAAPDSSQHVADSTIQKQQADTASRKNP
jgi:hypothetical protein